MGEMSASVRPVELAEHRDALLALSREYMEWVFAGVDAHYAIDSKAQAGVPFDAFVARSLDEVAASATLYGVFEGDALVGKGALRTLREGVGELKRMYVKPAARGKGYGRALLDKLLADARASKLTTVYLDSAPFMTAAHGLYRSIGFHVCDAYPETEIPEHLRAQWLFMEADLR